MEENSELHEKFDRWRRQAESEPNCSKKDFPWPDASNVVVPVTQTVVNTIFASLKASFGNKSPFFSIEANMEDFYPHAECIEDLLNILVEGRFHLNLRKVNNTVFRDLALLGTQFVESSWLKETQSYKDPSGEQKNRTIHNGPAVVPIRIEDFVCRAYITDIQRAPIFSHRHWFTKEDLKYKQAMGLFSNVNEIIDEVEKMDPNSERESQRIGQYEVSEELIPIYKSFYKIDIDNDGIAEDIIIWFEKRSGIILREEYNTFGYRPYVRISYIPLSNKLYGMGIGWMCESLQDETNTLHNMAIDATFLSSCGMAVAKKGTNFGMNENIYPGKIVEADNPKEDVVFTKFPGIGQDALQREYLVREYIDRVTGATAALSGQGDPYAKTRATAAGTMFLAQQGNRLFDAITENVEDSYGEIGLLIFLQIIHAEDKESILRLVHPQKQQYLREIFEMNEEDFHLRFNFRVTVTEIDQTEEAEKQKLLTQMQLYTMYGENMFKLISTAIQMGIQPAVEWAQRYLTTLIEGQTKVAQKIMEMHNSRIYVESKIKIGSTFAFDLARWPQMAGG